MALDKSVAGDKQGLMGSVVPSWSGAIWPKCPNGLIYAHKTNDLDGLSLPHVAVQTLKLVLHLGKKRTVSV